MSKRKNGQLPKSGTKRKSSPPKQPRKKKEAKPADRAVPCWLAATQDPFVSSPCRIPDDEVTPSGTLKSDQFTETHAISLTGSSTVFNDLYIFWPHINTGYSHYRSTYAGSDTFLGAADSFDSRNRYHLDASAGHVHYLVRPTALAVEFTYEGTEFERSGIMHVGLIPVSSAPVTYGNNAGYGRYNEFSALGILSTDYDGAHDCSSVVMSDVKSAMRHRTTTRVGDGPMRAVWHPATLPSYQRGYANGSPMHYDPHGTAGADTTGTTNENLYSSAPGSFGPQIGQYALVVIFEGLQIPAAFTRGPAFDLHIVAHWEIIPDEPSQVAYPLQPSTADVLALQASINCFGGASVSRRSPRAAPAAPDPTPAWTTSLPAMSSVVDGIRGAASLLRPYAEAYMRYRAPRMAIRN